MRIDPSHQPLPPPYSLTTSRSKGPGTPGGSSSSSRVLSPALQGLADTLQQIPEVRQDLLDNISARLTQGELLSPAVLQDTITAMLKGS